MLIFWFVYRLFWLHLWYAKRINFIVLKLQLNLIPLGLDQNLFLLHVLFVVLTALRIAAILTIVFFYIDIIRVIEVIVCKHWLYEESHVGHEADCHICG